MFQSLLSLFMASALSFSSAQGGNSEAFDAKTLLSVSPLPSQKEDAASPGEVFAQGALVIDLDTQSILYEKNSYSRRPIASLTKLMTAYIILKETDPSSIVTVSAKAAGTEGSRMGLSTGERISVRNLLYGLLIESGNDAAVALAEFNAGSETDFIKKMNEEAKNLGMENTHYATTTGLDNAGAYSTPHDLSVLSSRLLKDESVRDIVKNASYEVTSEDGHLHKLTSTNILLGQMGIEGLKTGKTPLAGECLVALAKNENGHEILSIVIGSANRFTDTKILVDWTYKTYVW